MAIGLDPSVPGFIDDPYPVYDRLRAQEPVHYSRKLRAWVLTRYADADAFFRDPNLTADRTKAARFTGPARTGSTRSLMTDGPGYTSLRALAAGFLSVREVDRLRPRVEAVVDALLDDAGARGDIDLVSDFAFPLPVAVIADLLGVPEDARRHLWNWSMRTAAGMDHYFRRDDAPPDAQPGAQPPAGAQSANLLGYFRSLVHERRAQPRDDFISRLVTSQRDGDTLTDDEIVALCSGLLFAGHETTTNLISNGVLALLNHPAELARLRAGEVSARSAVEELLRFESPAHAISRIATADVVIDGVTIPRGDIVLGMLGAMNRDPAVFDDPNELRLDRSPNRHVAFGEGTHFCWGAPLSRLEGTVAIPALFARFPKLRMSGEPRRRGTLVLRGLESMPLALR